MSPLPTSAKLTLSYPLYGADFDPLNSDFLLVGGGGGEGRSGVGNKISLLDVSRRNELAEIVNIDLSREEDSVTSLAVAQSTDTSITAYAGINSSQTSQNSGRNTHFRSFRLHHPPRKGNSEKESSTEKSSQTSGRSEALGQTSFFKISSAPKKETYQRLIRVSTGERDSQQRLAAIATGLAVENEIVVLRATAAPNSSDEVARIVLEKEAADLDIAPVSEEDSDHLLAFCTDTEVFVQHLPNVKADSSPEPTFIYGIPAPDVFAGSPARPKFRSLRFLARRHILLVQNLPQRTGVELLLLRISESGDLCRVVLQKRLNKITKAAVAMDICKLSKAPSGVHQIVVAVAGQGGSIEILTIEYSSTKGLAKFRTHVTLKDVHPASITKLAFSTFIPPTLPVSKDTGPQFIKLASVSVGQTVVVHTLPLQPYPPSKSKTPRYVMATPGTSDAVQATFSVFMATLVIAFAAFLLQAFTEIRGGSPPILGAADWLSPGMKQMFHRPYIFAESPTMSPEIPVISSVSPVIESETNVISVSGHNLEDLVAEHASAETPKAIVIKDDGSGDLSTEVHHDIDLVPKETLTKWEDLKDFEKEGWKKKLSDAGHWSSKQGEAVLKGIFFSEFAGVVGEVVRGLA